ncbi:MAG: amidohydrolase family protein [Clostridiales bacterium]|nr:amidohydrolase family protein [Clostridiales bacterium]
MIIDFHTHIFPDALAGRAVSTLMANIDEVFTPVTDATASGLLNHMGTCGVDISVVQPVITKQSQFRDVNLWAQSICSDKLISFGGIYPHTDDYKRDIDFVVSLGLKGLKFHAEYQNFVIDDPKMLRIYDYALSRGLVILHHAGFDPGFSGPVKTGPRRFRNIADAMKGGTIVAAHFGGHDEWDDVERYIVGTNIHLDTSMGFEYFPKEQFLRIVRGHGVDKILFASDSPWSNAVTEIAHLRALPLSETEKDSILSGNAKRILNLSL